MKKPEILAPAGSMESLTAAVNCGANVVYIGGKNFSARQNATNFDQAELKQAVEYCHLRNVKVYLTVNTILFDNQLEDFAEFVVQAAECGVEAFIVQDFGACEIIRKNIPNAVIHGSTQMTVHSVNGALFLKEKGFKRVVLSRELSKETIEKISSLGIETEIFVHGALCMSVSGQCYMSALIGQRSANRGLCAQPCRLPYSARKNSDFTALSLKDLTLTQHMQELCDMGITSFKIEGRMKRPEYVASAVTACRQAIMGEKPDISFLRAVFSRNGFTDGYFTGNLKDMFGHREKEDIIAAAKLLPEIKKMYEKEIKVHTVNFSITVRSGVPAVLQAQTGGKSVTVTGEIPQVAVKKPIDREYLERQLSKVGGTVFEFGGLTAEFDEGLILSAKALNAMRRDALEKLSREIISENTCEYIFEKEHIPPQAFDDDIIYSDTKPVVRARISSLSQLDAAREADVVIMPAREFLKAENTDLSGVIIEPPRFIVNEEKTAEMLEECRRKGAEHLICNNISYLKTGRELGFTLHGDFGLNISNSLSLEFFGENGLSDCTLSFEMKLSSIARLKKSIPTGIIAYGYLPAMLTRNCPIKNEVGCKNCQNILTDRKNCENKVVCHGDYTEILNSQCLYMADRLEDIRNISFITLYFNDETPKEITSVIREYTEKYHKRENITRGLYYRGIL